MSRIVIDGNIGSGKSTVLQHLQNEGYQVVTEPIAEWAPYLEQFYQNMKQFSLSFQMKVLQHHMLVGQTKPNHLQIVERSPLSCLHVFGKHLVQSNDMTDLDMKLMVDYNKGFGWVPTYVIYIQTDPKVCQHRIQERNRSGETIPLDYLSSIDEHYRQMYQSPDFMNSFTHPIRVDIVDGNKPKELVYEQVVQTIQKWSS